MEFLEKFRRAEKPELDDFIRIIQLTDKEGYLIFISVIYTWRLI